MESEYEGHVGPAGEVIHIGVGYCAIADALLEYFECLFSGRNVLLGHVLDVDSFSLVLSNLKVDFSRIKQVSDLLHIDLHHTDLYPELQVVWATSNSLEDRRNATRQQSL